MGGQRHTPSALRPGKETRYPLYRRLGGPQRRSERVREDSPSIGIRNPDHPARSESLYRLSYPDPLETPHVYTNVVSPQVRHPPCLLAKTVIFYVTPRVKHNSALLIMSISQTILRTWQWPYHRSLFKQDTFLPDRRRDGQALPSQLINLMEQNRSWKAKGSSDGH
jgi:hypothetical protein